MQIPLKRQSQTKAPFRKNNVANSDSLQNTPSTKLDLGSDAGSLLDVGPEESYNKESLSMHNKEQDAGGGDDSEELILPAQYMQSVEHVLDDIGEVKALETSIAHFSLGYVGTFDCLAEYKGTLCLIDWKTSKKPKSTLADCYDYPLQAVAYAGAINQDPTMNLKVLNHQELHELGKQSST